MKKTFISLVIAIVLVLAFVWISKPSITAYLLSREFGVPVSIDSMAYSTNQISAKNLVVSNPKGSKTKTALKIENSDIQSTFSQIFGTPLTIDQIDLNTITLGVELYQKGNNWETILSTNGKKKEKKGRPYLIKKLNLTNLTVVLTDKNGQTKTYGPIDFTFTNISDKSGFPLRDIEKAIMQQIINEIIKQFNIPDIIKNLDPSGLAPQILPLILPSS